MTLKLRTAALKLNPEDILVVVVMGSRSDLSVMHLASELLTKWGVPFLTEIVSAHRTPNLLKKKVSEWQNRGVRVIIAGAGGSAHLPGMLASFSSLPVIGVPIKTQSMQGLDSLLSIVQMPAGVPVATVAVDGSINAALLAIQILSLSGSKSAEGLRKKMKQYKAGLSKKVEGHRKELSLIGYKKLLKSL